MGHALQAKMGAALQERLLLQNAADEKGLAVQSAQEHNPGMCGIVSSAIPTTVKRRELNARE